MIVVTQVSHVEAEDDLISLFAVIRSAVMSEVLKIVLVPCEARAVSSL
jgi:hypothetical protein